MSLTVSFPFSIETYDPPSSPHPPSYDPDTVRNTIVTFNLETVEIGPSAAAFETAGKGQVLGGQNVKKSTLPDSKADNLENVDKTPP